MNKNEEGPTYTLADLEDTLANLQSRVEEARRWAVMLGPDTRFKHVGQGFAPVTGRPRPRLVED